MIAVAGAAHAVEPASARRSTTPPDVKKAVALVEPTRDSTVHGTVTFERTDTGVRVVADLSGLPPGSTHGFHIHEFGDCTGPDATTAGDHFAPEGHPHGSPWAPPRHAGDLGNVTADGSGRAHLDLTVDNFTVSSGRSMILGRSVIVHAQPDDFTTQPSGAAGPRLACGVIGAAPPGNDPNATAGTRR